MVDDATTSGVTTSTTTATTASTDDMRVIADLSHPDDAVAGELYESAVLDDAELDARLAQEMPVLTLAVVPANDTSADASADTTRGVYAQFCTPDDDATYADVTSDDDDACAILYAASEEDLRASVGSVVVEFALQTYRQRAAASDRASDSANDRASLRTYELPLALVEAPTPERVGVALLPGENAAVVYRSDAEAQTLFRLIAAFAQRVDVRFSAPSDDERAAGIEQHVECDFLLMLVPGDTSAFVASADTSADATREDDEHGDVSRAAH